MRQRPKSLTEEIDFRLFYPKPLQESNIICPQLDPHAGTNFTEMFIKTRLRHEMETFYALPAICAGNSSVTGEFPA